MSQRSLVAGVIVLFRAVETGRPAGARVLEDPWARYLIERGPRVQAGSGLAIGRHAAALDLAEALEYE